MSSDEADELPSTSNSGDDIWGVIGSENNLVPLLLKPEGLLTSLLGGDDESSETASDGYSSAKQQLVKTSQDLFRFIEKLASMEIKLKDARREQRISELGDFRDGAEEGAQSDDELVEPSTLSGLSSLFTGQTEESVGGGEDSDLDFETIWGQVDLQNTALLPILKKMTRKLAKRAIDENSKEADLIRLLDGGADSEDEQEDGGESSEGSVASELDEDASDNDDGDDSEDSDARRVRERMEKTMADMDDMDDEEDGFGDLEENDVGVNGKEDKLAAIRAKASALEEAIDPTREDMRDVGVIPARSVCFVASPFNAAIPPLSRSGLLRSS